MIEIAHLLVCKKCNHSCKLCCNKLYNLEEIPVISVEELKTIHTLCITGGEPLLVGTMLIYYLHRVKQQYPNIKNIYIYTTSDGLNTFPLNYLPNLISGLTITPKSERDWKQLALIAKVYPNNINQLPSNRLYVFKDQIDTYNKYKDTLDKLNIQVLYRKWDEKFVTPDNEIFRRLSVLLELCN